MAERNPDFLEGLMKKDVGCGLERFLSERPQKPQKCSSQVIDKIKHYAKLAVEPDNLKKNGSTRVRNILQCLQHLSTYPESNRSLNAFVEAGLGKMMAQLLLVYLHLIRDNVSEEFDVVYEEILDTIAVIAEHSNKARTAMATEFCSKLIQIALNTNLRFSTRAEAIKTVNLLLERCPSMIREQIREISSGGSQDECAALACLIPDAGDYEFQVGITETLFRFTNRDNRPVLAKTWFTDELYYETFCRVRDADFETDCRVFLNTVNSMNPIKQSVASFPCLTVHLGDYKLEKPQDEGYVDFWIDFNGGSHRISLFCNQESEDTQPDEPALWETVAIKETIISSCEISETEDDCVVLHLTTSGNTRNLIGFGPEFNDNNIMISFALDKRQLRSEHIIAALRLAYPNKMAKGSRSAKVSSPQVHVEVGPKDDKRSHHFQAANAQVGEDLASQEFSQELPQSQRKKRRRKVSEPAVLIQCPTLVSPYPQPNQATLHEDPVSANPKCGANQSPAVVHPAKSPAAATRRQPAKSGTQKENDAKSKTPKRVKTPLQLVGGGDATPSSTAGTSRVSTKVKVSIATPSVPVKHFKKTSAVAAASSKEHPPTIDQPEDVEVVPSSAPEERVAVVMSMLEAPLQQQLPALAKPRRKCSRMVPDDSGVCVDVNDTFDDGQRTEHDMTEPVTDNESIDDLHHKLIVLSENDVTAVYSKGVNKVSSTPALSTVSEESTHPGSGKSHKSNITQMLETIEEAAGSEFPCPTTSQIQKGKQTTEDVTTALSPEIENQTKPDNKATAVKKTNAEQRMKTNADITHAEQPMKTSSNVINAKNDNITDFYTREAEEEEVTSTTSCDTSQSRTKRKARDSKNSKSKQSRRSQELNQSREDKKRPVIAAEAAKMKPVDVDEAKTSREINDVEASIDQGKGREKNSILTQDSVITCIEESQIIENNNNTAVDKATAKQDCNADEDFNALVNSLNNSQESSEKSERNAQGIAVSTFYDKKPTAQSLNEKKSYGGRSSRRDTPMPRCKTAPKTRVDYTEVSYENGQWLSQSISESSDIRCEDGQQAVNERGRAKKLLSGKTGTKKADRPLPLSVFPKSLQRVKEKAAKSSTKQPEKRKKSSGRTSRNTKPVSYCEASDSDEELPFSQDPCLLSRHNNVSVEDLPDDHNSPETTVDVQAATKEDVQAEKAPPYKKSGKSGSRGSRRNTENETENFEKEDETGNKLFNSRSKSRGRRSKGGKAENYKSTQESLVEQVFGKAQPTKQSAQPNERDEYDYNQFDDLFIEEDSQIIGAPTSKEVTHETGATNKRRTYSTGRKRSSVDSKKSTPKNAGPEVPNKFASFKRNALKNADEEDQFDDNDTTTIDLPKHSDLNKQIKPAGKSKQKQDRRDECEELENMFVEINEPSPQQTSQDRELEEDIDGNEGDVSSMAEGAASIHKNYTTGAKYSATLNENRERIKRYKKQLNCKDSESEMNETLSVEKAPATKPQSKLQHKKSKRGVFSDTPDDATDCRSEVSWLCSTGRRKKPPPAKTYSHKHRDNPPPLKSSASEFDFEDFQDMNTESNYIETVKPTKNNKQRSPKDTSHEKICVKAADHVKPPSGKPLATKPPSAKPPSAKPPPAKPLAGKPLAAKPLATKQQVLLSPVTPEEGDDDLDIVMDCESNYMEPAKLTKKNKHRSTNDISHDKQSGQDQLYFNASELAAKPQATKKKQATAPPDDVEEGGDGEDEMTAQIRRDLQDMLPKSLFAARVMISPLELTPSQSPVAKRSKQTHKEPKPKHKESKQTHKEFKQAHIEAKQTHKEARQVLKDLTNAYKVQKASDKKSKHLLLPYRQSPEEFTLRSFIEDEMENFRFEKSHPDVSLDVSPVMPIARAKSRLEESSSEDTAELNERQEAQLTQKSAVTHISSVQDPKTPFSMMIEEFDEEMLAREAQVELMMDMALTGSKSGPSKRSRKASRRGPNKSGQSTDLQTSKDVSDLDTTADTSLPLDKSSSYLLNDTSLREPISKSSHSRPEHSRGQQQRSRRRSNKVTHYEGREESETSEEEEEETQCSQSSTRSLLPRKLFDDKERIECAPDPAEASEVDSGCDQELDVGPCVAVPDPAANTSGSGIMSILGSFSKQMQGQMNAKQAVLKRCTKQTLKTTEREIDAMWNKQQERRNVVMNKYRATLSKELIHLESQVKSMENAEMHMIEFFKRQQELLRKSASTMEDGIKRIRTVHGSFQKEHFVVEKAQVHSQQKIKAVLQDEMKSLQKRILTQTQQQDLVNVKRSLQAMFM